MKTIKTDDFILHTSDKTFNEVCGDLINQLHIKRVKDGMINEIVKKIKSEKYKKHSER